MPKDTGTQKASQSTNMLPAQITYTQEVTITMGVSIYKNKTI